MRHRRFQEVARRMAWLCLAAAAALAPAAALAQDKPVIRLVTGNAYHPYTDETLPGGGLAVELVKRVFDEMGFSAEVEFMSWDEGYEKTRTGEFIATFPYIVSAERKQHFAYTTALFEVRPSLFWNVNRQHRIVEFSDVDRKSLCVPDGWAVDGYLKPLVDAGSIPVVTGASMPDCFQRLWDGSADIVSVDSRLGLSLAERIADTRWTKSRRFVEQGTSNHLIFTLKHPQAAAWVQAFDAAFLKLQEQGEIYAVVKDYYGG